MLCLVPIAAPAVAQSGLGDDDERGPDSSDVGSDGSYSGGDDDDDGGGNDDDDMGYSGSAYDPGGTGGVTDPSGGGGAADDDDDDGPTDGWVEPETSLSERAGDNQVAPGGNATGNASNATGGGMFSGPIIPPAAKVSAAKAAIGPVLNFTVSYVPTTGAEISDGSLTWTRFPYDDLGWLLELSFAFAFLLCVVTASVNAVRFASPFHLNMHQQAANVLRSFAAIIIGIGSYVLIITLAYNAVGDIARGIAPAPAELTSGGAELLKFGALTAFALGSLAQLGWDIVKWLGISYGIGWLLLVGLALLGPPVYVGAIYWRGSWPGQFCSTIVRMHIALLIAPILQAILVSAAWTLDWAASFTGFMAVVMSLVLLLLGIFVQPILLIIAFFSRRRAIGAVSMGAASIAGSSIASRMGEKARAKTGEKVGSAKDYGKQAATDGGQRVKDRARSGAAAAQSKWWDRGTEQKYVSTDAEPNTERQAMAERTRQSSADDSTRDVVSRDRAGDSDGDGDGDGDGDDDGFMWGTVKKAAPRKAGAFERAANRQYRSWGGDPDADGNSSGGGSDD